MHQMKYIQFKFYIREGNKGSSYLSLSYCCFLSVKCCRPHQTIEHTNSNILGQKCKRRGKRKEKKRKKKKKPAQQFSFQRNTFPESSNL